jgi:hypothetical protein
MSNNTDKKQAILQDVLKFIKQNKKYPRISEIEELGVSIKVLNYNFRSLTGMMQLLEKSNPEIIKYKENKTEIDTSRRVNEKDILEGYFALCLGLDHKPKMIDIMRSEIASTSTIHRKFGTIKNLHAKALEKYGDKMPDLGMKRVMKASKNEIVAEYAKLCEQEGRFLSNSEMRNKEFFVSTSYIQQHFGSINNLKKQVVDNFPHLKDLKDKKVSEKKHTREELIEDYVRIYKTAGYAPTYSMLKKFGFIGSESSITRTFTGIRGLEDEARKNKPQEFSNITIQSVYSKTKIKELGADLKKYKRFIITTAVTGCKVHEPTFRSLKKLCEKLDAKLLILLCSDPAKPKSPDNEEYIDIELTKETIVFSDIKLNNNLHIDTFKTSAKQIKPTTGMGRISKKTGSMIFASPKFFLEYVSVRNAKNKLAHCIMTTGAITIADYNADFYMAQRTAKIATYDHTYGAVYVEIENKDIFHFRQIEIRNDQGILFFGNKKIQQEKIETIRPEGLVLGDLHVGATDPAVERTFNSVIDKYKPKRIFIHDGLDGFSINHWLDKNFIELVRRAKENLDNLEQELDLFCLKMTSYASKCEQLIIVPSNHNDWLEDWINLGKFMKDYKNAPVGIKLANALINEHADNALKYYYEQIYKGKKSNNILWLGRNEDFFISDVQLNCHGDIGTGGSRGSLQSMENAYVASISGHGHLAAILRDAWRTGTMTFLQESYNNGPGPWTNTSCLIYDLGCRSLINHINGTKNGFYSEKF